jgi:hypothetical protein
MKTRFLLVFICSFFAAAIGDVAVAQISAQLPERPAPKRPVPKNFARENLVAWCIVPFDAKQRGPEARPQMLADVGIERCAYDWREKHVPTFEQEILAYRKHGIEYTAFWGEHPAAFELFAKYGLTPGIWMMLDEPDVEDQATRITETIEKLMPLVEKTAAMKCKLGLYNHGGWGGEPKNLVAVCDELHERGHDHVGIIYNFHHGHGDIEDFADRLKMMLPYLQCLNLNGMSDLKALATEEERRSQKIKPIGSGEFEKQMIRTVIDSGYEGPVGVLGHVNERDVAEVLRENLEGLEYLLGEREKPDWLTKLIQDD